MSIDITPILIAFCLVVGVVGGLVGWAAWWGGAAWRDRGESRRGGGVIVLWFGRIIVGVAVVNLALAGLLIVGNDDPWASDDEVVARSNTAVFPDLSSGVRRVGGVNGKKEAAANRQIRSEFPEMPGAQLVSQTDRYVIGEDPRDDLYASGVLTEWTYRIEGATKCQIADALERPLVAHGWTQQTLETAGIPPEAGNSRATQLYRSAAFIEIMYGAPPTTFTIRIQAVRRRDNGSKAPIPTIHPSSGCVPDRPPPPPHEVIDQAAFRKANHAIYARLPIPAGTVVTATMSGGATAWSPSGNTLGIGSRWNLQLPPGNDPCGSAKAFDAAMAKAGWERFTSQTAAGRESRYFQPPRLVEATWTGTGSLSIFVVNNGAVVGPRQHPQPKAFSPGATPESRGTPVACTTP